MEKQYYIYRYIKENKMENLNYFLLEEELIKNITKESPKKIVFQEDFYESYELIATIQIKEEEVKKAIEELSEYLKGIIKFKNKYYKSSYGKIGLEASSHYFNFFTKEKYEEKDKRDNCQAKVYKHNLKEEVKFNKKENKKEENLNFYNLIKLKTNLAKEEIKDTYLKFLLNELNNSNNKTINEVKVIVAIKTILSYQVKENLDNNSIVYKYSLVEETNSKLNYSSINLKVSSFNFSITDITKVSTYYNNEKKKIISFFSTLKPIELEDLVNKIINIIR